MEIQVNFHASFFLFSTLNGSVLFESSKGATQKSWVVDFKNVLTIDENSFDTVFEGNNQFKDDIPYRWLVVKKDCFSGLFFELENHEHIIKGLALIDATTDSISVELQLKSDDAFQLDPFFHPIGILMLIDMLRKKGGIVVHASAVDDDGQGYIFSAVSGTGKSTMASLWKGEGALVINDDRVIIQHAEGKFFVYNTPMPWYQDYSKKVELSKVFLIKQSPENYIKPLNILQGALGLMQNCIQHQYNSDHVNQQLSVLEEISSNCGIFEIGFKPDCDIVALIREKFGQK